MRPDEFERLWSEHAEGLFAFLAYRARDRALAEDLLADTFVRAMRTRVRFDRRRGGEKGWLYSIALNLLRDHFRREGARTRAMGRLKDAAEGPPDELDRLAEWDEVAAALATLTPEERDLIALRYGGEMTFPELAALMGEQAATIERRLYRALAKLRDKLV